MSKIRLLIEQALVHKEKIEPNVLNSITNKTHYLANNAAYPQVVGGGNFLLNGTNNHFNKCIAKMKRHHNAVDITPEKYFEIKNGISKLLQEISEIEKEHKSELNKLAETIIRNYYSIPTDILFTLSDDDNNTLLGKNILQKDGQENQMIQFDDHDNIEATNMKIDRNRLNYALICGGSNAAMQLFKSYENVLDSIDHRLFDLYQKFLSFNHFNLWVTPDDVLNDEIEDMQGFSIYEQDGGYSINIQPCNFVVSLYEMSKAILSILFQEKYENSYVDYDSAWNVRIGTILWDDLIEHIKNRKKFPYVVDALNQLNDSDFIFVMKEVFAKTKHAKDMFDFLLNRIQ